ncbi:globin domain-containing protein [Sphingomonas sp. RB3P16]|uniref:globin domain-containing protein n=1 Tax=Parasphingomonas frigoris TaxID=3096163 RepID=UPI002FC96473
MALSDGQLKIIRESYCIIRESENLYSDQFYHNLFFQHPFIRALFPDDIANQCFIFRQTIDVLIAECADFGNIQSNLTDLSIRHIKYGAKIEHYAFVGEALIGTFEHILGDRFTLEVRQAWEGLYAETSKIMINAAYGGLGIQTERS